MKRARHLPTRMTGTWKAGSGYHGAHLQPIYRCPICGRETIQDGHGRGWICQGDRIRLRPR